MSYKQMLEVAAGSTVGAAHRKKGVNNQDSYKFFLDDDLFVGVVSDGCSAGGDVMARPEIGSALLCELFISAVKQHKFFIGGDGSLLASLLWNEVTNAVQQQLVLLRAGPEYVEKFLQATIVGVVIYKDKVYILSCGDGLYFVNGEQTTITPLDGNMPVYLAYKFMPTIIQPDVLEKELKFHLRGVYNLCDIEHLLIGTDGVQELIDAKEKQILVRNEPIGDISQWWTKDLYYRNPMAPTNWLRMMNSPDGGEPNPVGDKGYFKDDVTLIAIRKKKEVTNG